MRLRLRGEYGRGHNWQSGGGYWDALAKRQGFVVILLQDYGKGLGAGKIVQVNFSINDQFPFANIFPNPDLHVTWPVVQNGIGRWGNVNMGLSPLFKRRRFV